MRIFVALLIASSMAIHPKTAEQIRKENLKRMQEIKAKGEARKKEILAKYKKFVSTLRKFDRKANFAMPVQADRAVKLRTHDNTPGKRELPQVFAYVNKNYDLRSQAADSSKKAGLRLRKGDRVEVIFMLNKRARGTDYSWCLVRAGREQEGFVPNTFLQKYPVGKTSFGKKTHSVTARSGLNMRSGPGANHEKIMLLPYGAEVVLISYDRKVVHIGRRKGKWAKVSHYEREGWVFGPFLRKKGAKVTTTGSAKGFQMPVGGRISSPFGARIDPITKKRKSFHKGIDIVARRGTPIIAAANGKVYKAKWSGGYGKLIILEHANGFYTYYAHQKRFKSRKGQTVQKGDVIGYVGSTGRSTGPHLHFEVRKGRKALNPKKFMPN